MYYDNALLLEGSDFGSETSVIFGDPCPSAEPSALPSLSAAPSTEASEAPTSTMCMAGEALFQLDLLTDGYPVCALTKVNWVN